MFCSNNDSYMQDLYYYNQIPNNAFMNNFGNNILGNSNMTPIQQGGMSNIPNNQIFTNPGAFFTNNIQVQNLSSLYPSIYRILNPVISKIVSNNNQPISEELLNNMTDTVFNIVEGQIDFGDDQIQRNNSENQTVNSNSSSNFSSNNSTNRNSDSNRQTNQTSQPNNTRNNRNDSLFRDLIKILIIKELLHRNGFQRQFRK